MLLLSLFYEPRKEPECFGATHTLILWGHFLRPNVPDPASSKEGDPAPLRSDTRAPALPHSHLAVLKHTLAHSTSQPQDPQLQVNTSHMTQTSCPKQTNKSIDFSNRKHTIMLIASPVSAFHKPWETTKSWAEGAGRREGQRERGEVSCGEYCGPACHLEAHLHLELMH